MIDVVESDAYGNWKLVAQLSYKDDWRKALVGLNGGRLRCCGIEFAGGHGIEDHLRERHGSVAKPDTTTWQPSPVGNKPVPPVGNKPMRLREVPKHQEM